MYLKCKTIKLLEYNIGEKSLETRACWRVLKHDRKIICKEKID